VGRLRHPIGGAKAVLGTGFCVNPDPGRTEVKCEMPWTRESSPRARGERAERIARRSRNANWKKPPRRIESSECITCDLCVRNCPPEFGAIFDLGLDVVIVPELCSGCPVCVLVCPVDCIYVDIDEEWSLTNNDIWNHVELTAEV
jgi:Na+-translocating ferredoxin:NAD+ oxidoreductase subunit B